MAWRHFVRKDTVGVLDTLRQDAIVALILFILSTAVANGNSVQSDSALAVAYGVHHHVSRASPRANPNS